MLSGKLEPLTIQTAPEEAFLQSECLYSGLFYGPTQFVYLREPLKDLVKVERF